MAFGVCTSTQAVRGWDVGKQAGMALPVHLRCNSWNLSGVIWWAQPQEPNKRGRGVGKRLEGPPHPELQWIPGPTRSTVSAVVAVELL